MSMKKFCLFAYKPDSDDYCRGCHMASYSSQSIILTDVREDDIIAALVEIKKANDSRDHGEAWYESCVIFEGEGEEVEDYEDPIPCVKYTLLGDIYIGYTKDARLQKLIDKSNDVISEEKRKTQEKELLAKKEADKLVKIKKAEQKKQREKDEKALFEKLKNKYQ